MIESLLLTSAALSVSQPIDERELGISELIAQAENASKAAQLAFERVQSIIDLKIDKLNHLESTQQLIKENAAKSPSIVKLNVRGKMFQIYRSGLERIEGNYFQSMLASPEYQPGEDGAYFIDRPYEAFERILLYLSDGVLSFEGLNSFEARILRSNLDYFKLRPQ